MLSHMDKDIIPSSGFQSLQELLDTNPLIFSIHESENDDYEINSQLTENDRTTLKLNVFPSIQSENESVIRVEIQGRKDYVFLTIGQIITYDNSEYRKIIPTILDISLRGLEIIAKYKNLTSEEKNEVISMYSNILINTSTTTSSHFLMDTIDRLNRGSYIYRPYNSSPYCK